MWCLAAVVVLGGHGGQASKGGFSTVEVVDSPERRAHHALSFSGLESTHEHMGKRQAFAVGVNAAVDLIISGTALLKAAGLSPSANPKLHDRLWDGAAVEDSFSYALSTGTGSERIYADADGFKRLVEAAKALPSKQFFTGGNAALIGQHILESSTSRGPREVMLVAGVGPLLAELLHPRVVVPLSGRIDEDEVHLILEFDKGEVWGDKTAPRANRFIVTNDRTNAEMRPLDIYPEALADFDATMVVFSGVHGCEGEPPAVRLAILDKASAWLLSIPASLPIHLELASLADLDFARLIGEKLVGAVDSLGLNEQELSILSRAIGGPHMELLESTSFEKPEVAVAADLVHWLLTQFGAPAGGRLTRVHFHTLHFHLVGSIKGAWATPRGSVACGSLSCSERACRVSTMYSNGSYAGRAELRMPETFSLGTEGDDTVTKVRSFDADAAVVEWEQGEVQYALAPVLVCTPPEKTVGLGDAISASGLECHEFLKN